MNFQPLTELATKAYESKKAVPHASFYFGRPSPLPTCCAIGAWHVEKYGMEKVYEARKGKYDAFLCGMKDEVAELCEVDDRAVLAFETGFSAGLRNWDKFTLFEDLQEAYEEGKKFGESCRKYLEK